MKNKLLLLVLCVSAFSFGQNIPEDVKPPSWKQPNEFTSSSKPFKLQSFDLKSIQDEDLIKDKDKSKPWRFGHELYVDHNFNEVGKWTTLPNGDKVWRMSYTSEGALSLNFFFDVFWIPEGAKLYVYNNEKTDIIKNNIIKPMFANTGLIKGTSTQQRADKISEIISNAFDDEEDKEKLPNFAKIYNLDYETLEQARGYFKDSKSERIYKWCLEFSKQAI